MFVTVPQWGQPLHCGHAIFLPTSVGMHFSIKKKVEQETFTSVSQGLKRLLEMFDLMGFYGNFNTHFFAYTIVYLLCVIHIKNVNNKSF